ncbi:unnamed protein product, partial [Rhizoctonia solani]
TALPLGIASPHHHNFENSLHSTLLAKGTMSKRGKASKGKSSAVGYSRDRAGQAFHANTEGQSSFSQKPDAQGLNILCLDGGGIRGLSELILISETMNRLGGGSKGFLPADYFDVIAGSGTGGVIACLLGRLRMSIEAAIVAYGKLVQEAFSERKTMGSTGGAYVAPKLQKALKAMVKEATGNEDEKMYSEHEHGCRTMVFAMSKHNLNSSIPVMFRSYLASANPGPDCTIWEALYATMAHPDLFDSIDIGDYPLRQSFIGGEIGNSNPIGHVLSEVRSIYLGRYVSCVLSIGAGHPRTIQIPDSQISRLFRTKELVAMKDMATDSDRVAEDMARRFEEVKGVYFRLSVDQGMQNVDTDDWEKLDDVAAHTHAYLSKFIVNRAMNLVVQAIKHREAMVAVAWIDGRIQIPIKRPITLKYCPAPISVFTGRDDEIERIGLCVAGGIDERRVCVLHGLGGAGKSQLAFKVVEKNRDYWTRVIYVNASSQETVEETLRALAIDKGVGESHNAALDWLGCLKERWLLVLDNVNHRSISLCIQDYFPHGNRGSIIITTCLADLVLHARGPNSAIQISGMASAQALRLLSKVLGLRGRTLSPDDAHVTNELLEDLGHLAPAIVHSGAYIGHNPHMAISEYRRLFLDGRQRMLEQYNRLPVRIDDYQAIYTTWVLCYGLLEQKASQQLLWFIAFLYPRGIRPEIFEQSFLHMESYHPVVPLSNLERGAENYIKEYLGQFQDDKGHWGSNAFSHVISELASYSLIEFDRTNSSYGSHILVQDWIRFVVLEQSEISDRLEQVTALLSRSVGCRDIESAESLSFKRALGSHVNKILGEHSDRVGVNHATYFADVFKARGEWDKEELLRIQVKKELEEHQFDSGHQHVLKNADDLVAVYRNQGKWTEAKSLCSYVWETRKHTLGDYHIETITSAVSLIEIYQRHNLLESARELHKEVAQSLEWGFHRCLAALDDATSNAELELNRMGSLAIQLFQSVRCLDHTQGTLLDMIFIYDLVLKKLARYGETHVTIRKLNQEIAALEVLAGCVHMAMRRYETLLCAQKLALGSGHRDTQATMQTLVDVYLALGRWKEANEIQRQMFDMYEFMLDEKDRTTSILKIAPLLKEEPTHPD